MTTAVLIWLGLVGGVTVLGGLVWALLPDAVTFDAKTICVPVGDGLHLQPLRVLGNRISWNSLAISLAGAGVLALSGPPAMVMLAGRDLGDHLDDGFGVWLGLGAGLILLVAVGLLMLWIARGLFRLHGKDDPVVEIRFQVDAGGKHLDIVSRRLWRSRAWRREVEDVQQVYVACRQQVEQVGLMGGNSFAGHGSVRPFLLLRDEAPLPLMSWGRDGLGARKLVEMIRAWCEVEAVFDDRYETFGAHNLADAGQHAAPGLHRHPPAR